MVIAVIAGYAFLEFLVRKMRDQFRKHEAAGVHSPLCNWGADGPEGWILSFRFKSFPVEIPVTLF